MFSNNDKRSESMSFLTSFMKLAYQCASNDSWWRAALITTLFLA
jgi:hypothetical protein